MTAATPGRAARARPGLLLLTAASLVLAGLSRYGWDGRKEVSDCDLALLGLKQMNVSKTVKDHFPGAMKGSAVMSRVMRTLRPFKIRRGNTIYGQSISPDEINGDKGHLPVLMAKHFGHAFPLGGLGGAPFTGKTGFEVFSRHVPVDGHVVIVFGPHIGYTMDGEPGKFLRRGQAEISTACEPTISAHRQVSSWWPTGSDSRDAQQSWLRSKLKGVAGSVSRSDNPMVDLVKEAYEAVEQEMLDIVNTDFGSGNLVLIGGIQINMPYPMNGYFMPIHFSIRSAEKARIDLMRRTFG